MAMNPSDPRQKRIPPERELPIRNPLMPPPKANGAAAHESPHPASGSGKIAGDALRDALECGVRTAYTVIDEYLRRGYEAARSNRDHPDNRGHMREDRHNSSGWNNPWGPLWSSMMG